MIVLEFTGFKWAVCVGAKVVAIRKEAIGAVGQGRGRLGVFV